MISQTTVLDAQGTHMTEKEAETIRTRMERRSSLFITQVAIVRRKLDMQPSPPLG